MRSIRRSEDFESRLSRVLTEGADQLHVPSAPLLRPARLARTPSSRWNWRRRLVGTLIAACLALAAGIAVPLGVIGGGSGGVPRRVTLRLAAYSLRLPPRFVVTSAEPSTCRAYVVFGFRRASDPSATPGNGVQPQNVTTPAIASQVATAASASGGCINMVLTPAYTPMPTISDPEADPNATPVQVGNYQGSIVTDGGGVFAGTTELYVQIPTSGRQYQDIVIGSTGLSETALVNIVANGLSAPLASTASTAIGTS